MRLEKLTESVQSRGGGLGVVGCLLQNQQSRPQAAVC
jgi:hypothetical protein